MQLISTVSVLLMAGVLAWIPYVRLTPEYGNVVEILGARPAETATTDPAELEALLAEKTVLLIPEQQMTDEGTLERLGLAVADVLAGFLARGGRIVGMTYGKGADDILRGAGLWQVTDAYDVTGAVLGVALPDHPLAQGVSAQFEGTDGSTDFWDLPEGATVVVWDTFDEAPVVFWWETRGGTVVMLGFDAYEYTKATAQLLVNAVDLARATPAKPTAVRDGVVRDLDAAEIEAMLVALGYTLDARTDSYGDPFWVIYLDPATVALFVDDPVDSAPGRYQYLQLFALWATAGEISYEKVNDWNRISRGSRAYLDEEGDVVLESDLYLRDGVSRDTVTQFFQRFEQSVIRFKAYLGME